jgi:acyl carrier protein
MLSCTLNCIVIPAIRVSVFTVHSTPAGHRRVLLYSILEQVTMETESIKATIKQSISRVTGIAADTISDSASYEDDLGLDSLSVLEIAVEVESYFKFQASDEELTSIRTVEDTAELVRKRLCAQVA